MELVKFVITQAYIAYTFSNWGIPDIEHLMSTVGPELHIVLGSTAGFTCYIHQVMGIGQLHFTPLFHIHNFQGDITLAEGSYKAICHHALPADSKKPPIPEIATSHSTGKPWEICITLSIAAVMLMMQAPKVTTHVQRSEVHSRSHVTLKQ